MKKKIFTVLYPVLIAVYPVLALYGSNVEYVTLRAALRSLALALLLAGALLLLLRLALKNLPRAAALSAFLLAAVFSYGHVYLAYKAHFGKLMHHSVLASIYFVAALAFFAWILTRKSIPDGAASFLFFTAAAACLFAAVPILTRGVQSVLLEQKQMRQNAALAPSAAQDLPDIYFIILDSHTRTDVLQETYNYDNRAFIDGLKKLGFYVAECSQSNYPITTYSVSSMMNMRYLQDETNPGMLPPLSSSRVSLELRQLGYTFLRFENYSSSHFDLGEDVLLSRVNSPLPKELFFEGVSEFELMLIETTALRVFYDMPNLLPGVNLSRAKYMEHYLQTLYTLDTLPDVPQTGSPRFIYTHMLVPHGPYVFTPDGEYTESDRDIPGYRDNVEFIDRAILPVLEKIIRNSAKPPVIILQGDHGPAGPHVTPQMRHSILNAYYLKPEAQAALYPQISPINTFRVIFNAYFGQDNPLLEDKSYFSYKPEELTPEHQVPYLCPQGVQ